MRPNTLTFSSIVKTAACLLLLSPLVQAQAFKVEAEDPEIIELKSPQIDSGGTDKSFDVREWLEFESSFTVQMKPETASKTVDKVLVKWYVAVENIDKKKSYYLLTKDVTLVNVPLEKEVFVSAYLSPASVRRITGEDSGGKRAVFAAGMEVLINGEKVAAVTNDSKVGWWNQASDKISRTDVVSLLSKNETPFANLWWDRYAEILVED